MQFLKKISGELHWLLKKFQKRLPLTSLLLHEKPRTGFFECSLFGFDTSSSHILNQSLTELISPNGIPFNYKNVK